MKVKNSNLVTPPSIHPSHASHPSHPSHSPQPSPSKPPPTPPIPASQPSPSASEAGPILHPESCISHPAILHPESCIPHPKYSIRKHLGFWSLTFAGQEACFDHEQGAYYVAYLLLNPPSEPIHGLALEIKSLAYFGEYLKCPAATEIMNPSTGETMILACDAIFEQRHLALDDAASQRPLRRKINELEAILENPDASEPVKAEVQRELGQAYAWLNEKPAEILDEAQKAVRAVREAIRHFHVNLEGAVDPGGNPHPVLRPFADHVKKYLLIPSNRYSSAGRGRTRTGLAGRFTYEPPSGVKWTA